MGIKIIDFFDMPKNTPLYLKLADELIHAGRDNPVKGSRFEESTRDYKKMRTSEYFRRVKIDKYDALVIYDESYLYGYAAYQRQGEDEDEMHIFKLHIDEKVRGNHRLVTKLTKQCLEHARKKFKKVFFDKETDSRVVLEFLKTKEAHYNISVNLETSNLAFLPMHFEAGLF